MKNWKLWNIGDKVKIIRTHKNDLNKKGIIKVVHNSYCEIQILNDDNIPELNPQNNKPIINNHTYKQFIKYND